MMSIKTASWGTASLLAAAVLAGPALADGMPSRGRVAGPDYVDSRPCSISGSLGVTTDYVFRGVSQSASGAALQGNIDAVCGRFYVGVFGSSIDWSYEESLEFVVSAGFRHKTGPITWDLGLSYYTYPNSSEWWRDRDNDWLELKVGASGEVWRDATLGVTVFYSPDYKWNTGSVWTVEGTFTQALPRFHMFSPVFSATLGHQRGGSDYATHVNYWDDSRSYSYWNAGVTLGFLEKWSVDLRYWDTNMDNCEEDREFNCTSRVVGTVKYRF